MHHTMSVAVGSCLKYLIGEALNFMRGKGTTYLSHILLEVIVAVFEDQVELILRVDDFLEPMVVD